MDFPRASAVASRLVVAEESSSTNAELRERAADLAWPHLSVLVTDNQTAGRGRLDRTWTAPRGSALAISVLLRNIPQDPAARGWIPLLAGAAMAEAVASQLDGHEVGVKWPNDVLVDGKKICGILAEAAAGTIVVGSGVNTAMPTADLPVPTATSFADVSKEADADRLLTDYLRALDTLLRELCRTDDAVASGLHARVSHNCVTLGREVDISLPDGSVLHARASRLAEDGRLVIESDGATQFIAVGDVIHARLS